MKKETSTISHFISLIENSNSKVVMSHILKNVNNLNTFTSWNVMIIQDWSLLKNIPTKESVSIPHRKEKRKGVKWLPPTPHRWKTNNDGASCGNLCISRIGDLIWDSNGNIIKAACKKVKCGTNIKSKLEVLNLDLELTIQLG